MRVTMGTMMRNYSNRLARSLSEYNKAQTRAQTGRIYERPSENPSAAIRVSQLKGQLAKTNDYLNNLEDIAGRAEIAESNITNILKLTEDAYDGVLHAWNGTMGEDERKLYANQLRQMQEQLVMDGNVQYNDKYVLGGTSTQTPPFAVNGAGNLTYRGVELNTMTEAQYDAFIDDPINVDLGFGLQFLPGSNELKRGTAFDTSFPGVSFMGYGETDGIPNNAYDLMGHIADQLEAEPFDAKAVEQPMNMLKEARRTILTEITSIGTDTMFLEFTESRVQDTYGVLDDRLATTQYMDTELAYTLFMTQRTAYEAALKMGPSVLTPSFIDFMG